MFHKEGSSSLQVHGSSSSASNNNAGGNRGGGGGKKNNKKNAASTNKDNNKAKAMDVPLGKKERKQLKQRVLNYFESRMTTPTEDGGGGDSASSHQQLAKLFDHIFLQHDGNIMIRTLQPYPNNKAWTMNLYLISPSSLSSSLSNNDDDEPYHVCWPYQQTSSLTQPQFLWMALQEKKTIVHETPTVAFWSVLLHHLCRSLGDTEADQTFFKSILDQHTVVVPSACTKYVCRGADLMRAGIIPSGSSMTNGLYAGKDDEIMVAVRVVNNLQPFAVGILKKPKEAFGAGTKGVGVEIWNCYGDDLWRTTSTTMTKTVTRNSKGITNCIGGASFDNGHCGNVGFVDGKYVVPIIDGKAAATSDSDDEDADQEEGTMAKTAWDEPEDKNDAVSDPSNTNTTPDNDSDCPTMEKLAIAGNENEQATPTKPRAAKEEEQPPSPEDTLHHAVCQGLVSLANKDLPMPVTTFYSQYVLPNRPKGTTIDLKATKYKKFSNYIKEQIESGLIQAGPDKSNPKNTDPLAVLIGYRKKHDDLQGYSKDNSVVDTSASGAKAARIKLVLVTLYSIPSNWPELLRLDRDDVDATNASSEERKGTGMLTATEVRKILEKYIERENLIPEHRPDLVNLDAPLTKILYKKEPNPPTHLLRKDIQKLFLGKLMQGYALVEMPGSKITTLKKGGQPPKIEIEVQMRQSKKFVTRIRGLEDYGIDPNFFGKDVAKRLACSVSMEDDPVGRAALKKGRVELVFQGNVVDEIEALLTGDESLSSHGGIKNASSDYVAIPKNVLDTTLRKGVPARKRQGGGGKKKK